MRTYLNPFVLAAFLPNMAWGAYNSYYECDTVEEFTVTISQSRHRIPSGTTFKFTLFHVLTEERLENDYLELESGLHARRVDLWFEDLGASLPMVMNTGAFETPLPQGAKDMAIYDQDARPFTTFADLTRESTATVPLDCKELSGLY